ncbi:MAG: fliF [Burkholderiaceae bacterium]|nr:fliF [Burkholderiaceae bacterium]
MATAGEQATAPVFMPEAETGEQNAIQRFIAYARSGGMRTYFLILGIAAVIGIMAAIWLWSQKTEYKVLFSNYSDKDGGAIVTALQQMNVPYKIADTGNAILVPDKQVHDVRLRLASQGLPKGGGIGFELMENQKLGISQFLEQVNFQRALEGEMARSIQSIGAVQTARVHLALHKASVFVREQQKPTASVLLNLHPGRSLDQNQVNAIVHLVASSVPSLVASNVTVVDQAGNLLSGPDKPKDNKTLDPSQIQYVQELQRNIIKRVESILTPIVGENNVRAEATAEVDFSTSEQAAETYKPNQPPKNDPAIRSQQSSESQTVVSNAATGVPGALTNQPPVPATAPITQQQQAARGAAATAPGARPGTATTPPQPIKSQKDATVNYEVDKTIRYTQQPMGGLKRLTVAVVVNYKKQTDSEGKVVLAPLTEAEKVQVTDLVKEAMGYNKDRGDSLNVVNSPFASKDAAPETPLWKRPEMLALAQEAGKYILVGAILLYLFFAFLRPMMRKLLPQPPKAETVPPVAEKTEGEGGEEGEEGEEDAIVSLSEKGQRQGARKYEDNLGAAKQLAKQDPKVVANIIKNWVEE